MSELGARLIRARETRGLTIEDAERDTRISRRYLQALESEQFDVIPAPVYARGFLRSYSQYLGLDPQQMLQLFPRDDDPAYPAPPMPRRASPQNPMSAVGPARPTWKRPETRSEQEARPRPVGRQAEPPRPAQQRAPRQAPREEPFEPTIGIDIGVPVPARRIKTDPAAQTRTLTIAIVAVVVVVAAVAMALLISRLGGDDTPGGTLDDDLAGATNTPGTRATTPAASASGIETVPGTVPRVIDLSVETAQLALTEHKYTVRRVEQTSTAPKGRVLDQSPAAGSALPEGREVTLIVSKGP